MEYHLLTLLLPVILIFDLTYGELRLRHNHYRCFEDRPKIDNGYYEVLQRDGRAIKAHCDLGFDLVGHAVRLCDPSLSTFTGETPRCEDIDECLQLQNVTGNPEGSGYDPMILSTDADEYDVIPCHPQAQCVNTPGSYKCVCNDGLVGNGFHCEKPPESCRPFNSPENGWLKQMSWKEVHFFCQPDYFLWGEKVLQCELGKWSGEPPRCLKTYKPHTKQVSNSDKKNDDNKMDS